MMHEHVRRTKGYGLARSPTGTVERVWDDHTVDGNDMEVLDRNGSRIYKSRQADGYEGAAPVTANPMFVMP